MKQKIKSIAVFFLSAILIIASFPARTFANENGQLLFILDASSSMLATDGTSTSRMDKAKNSLSSALDIVPSSVGTGLRVYGHTVPDTDKPNGCLDTSLLNRPEINNSNSIRSSIATISAKGWTPIGTSLRAVENDFSSQGPKSVILISDGIDTCSPPDPCEVAKEIAAKGLNIKVNTIGLVVDNAARTQLTCIANATGGNYFDISDISRLNQVVGAVTQREANLFNAEGIPVKGNPRFEEAPFLLPNTAYVDSIIDGEELYYSIELLPEQSFRFSVRTEAVGAGIYRAGTALSVNWYNAETGERVVGVRTSPIAIINGVGSETIVFEDKTPPEITTTTKYVMRVDFSARGVTTPQPYELSYTTQGGVLPENKNIDEANSINSQDNDDSNDVASFIAPLLIGLLTPVLIAGAYVLYKRHKQKNQNAIGSNNSVDSFHNNESNDTDTTSNERNDANSR